jgi:hypothetical protein
LKCVKINALAKNLGITPQELKASLARLNKEGKVVFTPGKTDGASIEDVKAGMRIAGSTGNLNMNVSRTNKIGKREGVLVGKQSTETKIIAGEKVNQIVEGAVPKEQKGLSDKALQELRRNPKEGVPQPPPSESDIQSEARSTVEEDLKLPEAFKFLQADADVNSPSQLDGKLNGIFETNDVKDVGSRDTLMTSPVRGKNFIESLASPQAKVRLKNQGFKQTDITALEILTNPSFELARKYKGFQEAQQIAMTNTENNELLRNRHKLGEDGKLSKIFTLKRKLVEDYDFIIDESDKQQLIFTDDQLRVGVQTFDIAGKKKKLVRFNQEQIDAYKEHKRVTDNLLSDTMDVLDYTTMNQFADKKFASELKETIERKADSRVFRTFGQTITNIIQSDPESIPKNVADLIGNNADETIKNWTRLQRLSLLPTMRSIWTKRIYRRISAWRNGTTLQNLMRN